MEELLWRLDIVLAPIQQEIAQAINGILGAVDIQNKKFFDFQGNLVEWPKPEWSRAQHCWQMLSLAMVRAAREIADLSKASDWLRKLIPHMGDDPEFAHKVTHERCLLALSCLDHAELEILLKGWETKSSDPFWNVRKAAILAEINRIEEALDLVRSSINTLRRGMRKSKIDLPSFSREGWSLFTMRGLKFQQELRFGREFIDKDNEKNPNEHDEFFLRRWKELALYYCDANSDYIELSKKLEKKSRPSHLVTQVEKNFDLDEFSINHVFKSWGLEELGILPAFQMMRLTEVAGIPVRVGEVKVSQNALNLSAYCLDSYYPEVAALLGWRIARYYDDKEFKKIFTRTFIARMQISFVEFMLIKLLLLADYAFTRCNSHDMEETEYFVTRLRVAVELLSMLILRLPVDTAHSLLDRACQYYRSELFNREYRLHDELGHLFKRTLSVLPSQDCYRHLPVLALLPIPGQDLFQVSMEDRWPEPFSFWSVTHPHLDPITLHAEMGKPVEKLLFAMKDVKTRKRAAFRLIVLYNIGVLSQDQQVIFAEVLWDKQFIKRNGLPGETDIRDWYFMHLPEPEVGLAEKCFKSAYLIAEPENLEKIRENLRLLGDATRYGRRSKRVFALLPEEENTVNVLIQFFISQGFSFPDRKKLILGKSDDKDCSALVALGELLMTVCLPVETATKLLDVILTQAENCPKVFHLYPGLLRSLPDQIDQGQLLLAQLLASDNEDQAQIAMDVLYRWIQGFQFADLKLPNPPLDLVREVGTIIRVRRRATLVSALDLTLWIFENGDKTWKDVLASDCLYGLNILLKEADYGRSNTQSLTDDLPLLRYQCVKLAVAMSKKESWGEQSAIQQWISIAKEDPLAEVRHAILEYS
ncbi:MAG: hypothetical protein HQL65_19590 [Magnetococcales bacterium]|nr:hypothetical protein [Magnetococcales bacterium]